MHTEGLKSGTTQLCVLDHLVLPGGGVPDGRIDPQELRNRACRLRSVNARFLEAGIPNVWTQGDQGCRDLFKAIMIIQSLPHDHRART